MQFAGSECQELGLGARWEMPRQSLLGVFSPNSPLSSQGAVRGCAGEVGTHCCQGDIRPRIIIAMTMTQQQFELLARLLRSKEPVTTGARLVLLHNVPNAEAARTVGVTAQSVHRAAKRFTVLHHEILKTYKKVLASSSGR